MKKNRSVKLLSKTTIIYLVFTFTVFYGVSHFLLKRTDQYIDGELERRFNYTQKRIEHRLNSGRSLENWTSVSVLLVDSTVNHGNFPSYSDTSIYNEDIQEMEQYRKKTFLLKVKDNQYQVSVLKSAGDFYKLREDISAALFPAFILLALIFVLFNYLLSGYFFKPFNKILDQMRRFKVGSGETIEKVKTNTTEFLRMQKLFQRMVGRIEMDYRSLKEYTENMAHEIQTPLTIIRNKTENLIADDLLMQDHSSDVKIIYDESSNLSRLGSTLNLLTKIENGEFSSDSPLNTKPVIEQHIDAISESAQLKSMFIESKLSGSHILKIDPFLLDIILKNLLRNAIRYGNNNGPIRITTSDDELIISNYGPALDVPVEKIYKRFYRSDKTNTSLGLGLALVRKICELNSLSINYIYKEEQHHFSIVSDEN